MNKKLDLNNITIIRKLGFNKFCENYLQNLNIKKNNMKIKKPRWVLINNIKNNKLQKIIKYASEIQTLSNIYTANLINQKLKSKNKILNTLIQINNSTKYYKGIYINKAFAFLKNLEKYKFLNIKGFSTVLNNNFTNNYMRSHYSNLRKFRNYIQNQIGSKFILNRLSMGFSSNFKIAISEGSTDIKIGDCFFGSRNN